LHNKNVPLVAPIILNIEYHALPRVSTKLIISVIILANLLAIWLFVMI